MKKILGIILALVTLLCFSSCEQEISLFEQDVKLQLFEDDDKIIESIAEGGDIDGEYAFSMDKTEGGTLKLEDGKATCSVFYINDPHSFVIAKKHKVYTGAYKLDSDNNIIIEVEDCYELLELVGEEQHIKDYRDINIREIKVLAKDNGGLDEEDQKEIAYINGERKEIDDGLVFDSIKLRINPENNLFYIFSMSKDLYSIDYSYYDSGAVKDCGYSVGPVMIESIKLNEQGYELKNDAEQEFYDNGVIKKEVSYVGTKKSPVQKEFDQNGFLIRKTTDDDTIVYEYNSDGILIKEKEKEIDGRQYAVTTYIGYKRSIITVYDADYAVEDKIIDNESEYYGDEIIRETRYRFENGKNFISRSTETTFTDNSTIETEYYYWDEGNKKRIDEVKETFYDDSYKITYYSSNGCVMSEEEFDANGNGTKTEYAEKNIKFSVQQLKEYKPVSKTIYDLNGKKVASCKYDENGEATYTHYYEDGSVAPKRTYDYDVNNDTEEIRSYQRFYYDKNGNITEIKSFNSEGKIWALKRYGSKGEETEFIVYDEKTGKITQHETHTYKSNGTIEVITRWDDGSISRSYINQEGYECNEDGSAIDDAQKLNIYYTEQFYMDYED